jgi:hypothetical protein
MSLCWNPICALMTEVSRARGAPYKTFVILCEAKDLLFVDSINRNATADSSPRSE